MTDQQAFGLNRMDLLQREGKYNLPPQASKTVLGVEFAGTITETGEGASKFKVGDEVFGLAFGVSCGGSSAELTEGRVCRVHCEPRGHASPQAQVTVMGPGRGSS